MPLEQVLSWIHQYKKTGVLQLQRGQVAKDIFVQEGEIVSSGGNDPREYLGQFFISFGKLTEDDLVKAYQIQKETRVYLGKILVMINKASESQVKRVLLHKTRETLLDCFLWGEGNFAFVDKKEALGGLQISVSLDVPTVLKEGNERSSEWRAIREVVTTPTVPIFTNRQKFPPGFPEKPDDQKLIQLVEAGKKIPDLCYEFHMSEFLVTKRIYQLLQKEILRLEGRRGSDRGTPEMDQKKRDEQLKNAIRFYKVGNLHKALEVLTEILRDHPADQEASEYFEKVRKDLVAVISKDLTEDKIPNLILDPTKIDFSGYDAQEAYILSRVNGNWTIGEIVKICPFPPEKVLGTLERFLKQKVILV